MIIYRIAWRPTSESNILPAADHSALAGQLSKMFGKALPLDLGAGALPMLNGAAHATPEVDNPFAALIRAIEANGTIRVEQQYLPDIKAARGPRGIV